MVNVIGRYTSYNEKQLMKKRSSRWVHHKNRTWNRWTYVTGSGKKIEVQQCRAHDLEGRRSFHWSVKMNGRRLDSFLTLDRARSYVTRRFGVRATSQGDLDGT